MLLCYATRMGQTHEERLAKQRERDRIRRAKIKAGKIADGTYNPPSPAQLDNLRRIGFKRHGEEGYVPPPNPNKLPDETRLVYLAHLERGLRRGAAATKTGITTECVRKWRISDPEFEEAEHRAEEVAAEQIEDALWESARNGNTQAALYWLNNRAPKRWRDMKQKQVDVQVTHQGQIEAGDRLTQVGELLSRLESRALTSGPDPNIIDV